MRLPRPETNSLGHLPTGDSFAYFSAFVAKVLALPLGLALGLIPETHAALATETPVGWASQEGGTTGGIGGSETTVESMDALNAALKKEGKAIIWIKGTLTGRADVATNDKSVLGLPGAKIVGGMDVTGSSSKALSNIILRNFEIEGPGSNDVDGEDALTIQYASRVWVDHLYVHDGLDGNMDITNGADLVTVSDTKWEYLKGGNHAFCNLIGGSDSKTTDRGKLRVTFLRNWWSKGVAERMPRVRFGKVHVVNSYFNSASGNHCVRAGIEADLRVEANAFVGVKKPVDLYEGNYTAVSVIDNLFTSVTGNDKGDKTAFTPPYKLTLLPAAQVASAVQDAKTGAGPNLTWGATTALMPAFSKENLLRREPGLSTLTVADMLGRQAAPGATKAATLKRIAWPARP